MRAPCRVVPEHCCWAAVSVSVAVEGVGGGGLKRAWLRGGGGGYENGTEVDEEKACTGGKGTEGVGRRCEFSCSTTGSVQSSRLPLRGRGLRRQHRQIHVRGIHRDTSQMLLDFYPFPV